MRHRETIGTAKSSQESPHVCNLLYVPVFWHEKRHSPQYNIPPVRKLLPFRLRRLQNLRIAGNQSRNPDQERGVCDLEDFVKAANSPYATEKSPRP